MSKNWNPYTNEPPLPPAKDHPGEEFKIVFKKDDDTVVYTKDTVRSENGRWVTSNPTCYSPHVLHATMPTLSAPYKLNLGCGRNAMKGYINIDRVEGSGVDLLMDFENSDFPFPEDSVNEILLRHTLEHIQDTLALMERLWKVSAPDGICTIVVPYGSSDDAWSDQTHVRPYFMESFQAFGQPFYCLADYGYRGDWAIDKILLDYAPHARNNLLQIFQVHQSQQGTLSEEDRNHIALDMVTRERNVVREMTCQLKCVKPIREQSLDNAIRPQLILDYQLPSPDQK